MSQNFLTYSLNSSRSVLNSPFFQIGGRFHQWSLYLRMLGKGLQLKNYCPVSLPSVVSKVFEKLVNNRIVDDLEKRGVFSDFQYGFRSSRSIADLFTVVSDRIARVLMKSGATRAAALDISTAFDTV